jgi:hypothetical protein
MSVVEVVKEPNDSDSSTDRNVGSILKTLFNEGRINVLVGSTYHRNTFRILDLILVFYLTVYPVCNISELFPLILY